MTARTAHSHHTNLTLPLLLATFCALMLGNIFFSLRTLQAGMEIGALERQKTSLQKELSSLGEQHYHRQSLTTIAGEAAQLGLVPIRETVSVTLPSDTSVALR